MLDRSKSGHFWSCILLSVCCRTTFYLHSSQPLRSFKHPIRKRTPVLCGICSFPSLYISLPAYFVSIHTIPITHIAADQKPDSLFVRICRDAVIGLVVYLSGKRCKVHQPGQSFRIFLDTLKKVCYIPVKIINGLYIGTRFGEQDSPRTKEWFQVTMMFGEKEHDLFCQPPLASRIFYDSFH